jgi:leucyl/phenylalanyl-tRNA---protein transferase
VPAPQRTPLPWLEPGDAFPAVARAWGQHDEVAGLLAAGGALDVPTLVRAYTQGIFPWYSDDQPILWWSPNPRMVLQTADFKLHRSLRKTLAKFSYTPGCEVRIDHDFAAVINACAQSPRDGQRGTWIVQDMINAYCALHAAGHAHSVETWVDGQLVGGLYCTNVGGAVFGESMFSRASDASKIALAALVALCKAQGVEHIDCQQNTAHLASLGAREMQREQFCQAVAKATQHKAPAWQFDPVFWSQLICK